MKNVGKIRVIKKGAVAEEVSKEIVPPLADEPKPKDVFRNVSDWVKQNQARKRDEDRLAAEAFFGVGALRHRL